VHCSSQTDNDEAYLAGQAAVEAAIAGETDKMITLVRGDGETYTCETGLAPLAEIANGVKKLPESWINEDGVSMNYNFYKYALPLIQGEVKVPFENGVPVLAKLKMVKIPRKLGAHSFE
jgi:6-phosphofructokinase 1